WAHREVVFSSACPPEIFPALARALQNVLQVPFQVPAWSVELRRGHENFLAGHRGVLEVSGLIPSRRPPLLEPLREDDRGLGVGTDPGEDLVRQADYGQQVHFAGKTLAQRPAAVASQDAFR